MNHETVTQVVMNSTFWASTIIFIVAYIIIMSEKIHKTIVALFGAALMLVLKIISQHEAFHIAEIEHQLVELGVDWNVIFLLISMMLIINLMKPTGIFEYIAFKSAKLGKGDPFRIMVIFSFVVAVVSSLLDNVTTVLLITPVTLLIADALEVDPVPYLIACALASNIGGTATLIGDPPNIMIASKAGLNFMDFVYNLAPVVVIMMIAFLFMLKILFGKKMITRPELKERIMSINEGDVIKDRNLLIKSLMVLAIVLLGFIFHGKFHYHPATIALFGAALLLLLSGCKDPQHSCMGEVEWPTIFFFIGLFILVGGVVKVGLIKLMASKMLELTQGNMFATSMLLMWFSAFASAIVDNIPYVATMNPLVIDMANTLAKNPENIAWYGKTGLELLQHPLLMPLWWSLALGACLGGNGSAIGASANVIVVGLSEKAGKKITFFRFMAYGMPVMIVTLLISTIYVWLRYYVLKL